MPPDPYYPAPNPPLDPLRHFRYEHLPVRLQAISGPICSLAAYMISELPPGPELSAGLRHLLEAKDCFVRAELDRPPDAQE